MATIDTYVVGVTPKFDISAFRRIKTQIESLSKLANKIPIGFSVTNATFTGLKSQIRAKMVRGNYQIKIPVRFDLQGRSLSTLASDIRGITFKPFEYPVHFKLGRGATKDLREQLAGFKFKPVDIPARVILTGEGFAKIKDDLSRVNNLSANRKISTNSNNSSQISLLRSIANSTASTAKSISFSILKSPYKAVSGIGRAARTSLNFGVGGGLVYGAGSAVSSGMGSVKALDTNLLYTQSVFKATQQDGSDETMLKLREKVLNTAAKYPITVDDASEAVRVLAKNGANAEQILGGMFEQSVKSSLALRSSVSETADFMTDVSRTFEIPTEQFERLSKTLVGTTFSSKFDMQDVWYAFAQAGGQGSASSLTPEELGALFISTQATAKSGRDLGTQLKNLFRFFTVPKSNVSRKIMEDYGLTAFDDDGKITNIKLWIEQLQNLSKLSDENRLQVINDIFGADASKGAIALINKQLIEFEKNLNLINNVDVESAIVTQMSGIQGGLDLITSKWQDMWNAAFDTKTTAKLAEWLRGIASEIGKISEWFKEIGGLSGLWDKIMSSEFKSWLDGIFATLKALLKLIGIDVQRIMDEVDANSKGFKLENITNKKFVGYDEITGEKQYLQSNTGQYKRVIDEDLMRKVLNKDSDLQKPMFRDSIRGQITPPKVEVKIEQKIMNGDPDSISSATKSAIDQSVAKKYIDSVTSSGSGFAGEY